MKLILASSSPRRKQLLAGLQIPFEVIVVDGIDESYPAHLSPYEIAQYISEKKAEAYFPNNDEIIITADTVVVLNQEILGKPHDENEARQMLCKLSGKTHQVVSGVTIKDIHKKCSFSVTTNVSFKALSNDEICYYIENFHPLDKSGAYGIQEWLGYIAVTSISGSYFNVMGLPIQQIYETLRREFHLLNL